MEIRPEWSIRILLGAEDIGALLDSTNIHWATPSSCNFTISLDEEEDEVIPSIGQDFRVLIDDDDPRTLFHGMLQTVELSFSDAHKNWIWRCTAVDTQIRFNKYLPFGVWTDISATIVLQELVKNFAPGFNTFHVQPDLPTVTVLFNGNQSLAACCQEVMTQIGGYQFLDDLDLHAHLLEV